MKVSVCTAAQDPGEHLVNLVLGLRRSHRPPAELVIGAMQARAYDLPLASFPVRQVVLGEAQASLAAARNAAAAHATGELLVFLDPYCIPHPATLDAYAASSRGGLLMGEVAYLPAGATDDGVNFARFEQLAVRNPERPAPPAEGSDQCRDYRCFRGDNFALSARDFARVGGFDEAYAGTGGEDTDFARASMSAGLPLAWVKGAKAYHQHHAQAMPPVDRLDEVLANAALFKTKWNQPVMQDWLRAFALMGLAEEAGDGTWRKLREPDARDLALAERQAGLPFASCEEALDLLERQVGPRRPGPLRPAA